jgi:hypothetical protein
VHTSLYAQAGLNVPARALPAAGTVPQVRLWDAGVMWSQVEVAPGRYSWTKLDAFVEWGARTKTKILLVLGQPPLFYRPAAPSLRFSSASLLPPTSMKAWVRYVDAVSRRYRGRIEAYEPWNEVNLPGYYSGTADDMVLLTRIARLVIKRNDPKALIAAPSLLSAGSWSWPSMRAHLRALARWGWPVDVYNVHVYPWRSRPITGNHEYLSQYLRLLQQAGAPRKPIWNTEANIRQPLDPSAAGSDLGQSTAYYMSLMSIDSMTLGVTRMYWYAWESTLPTMTIVTRPGSTGTLSLRSWAPWAAWALERCRSDVVTACTFAVRGRRVALLLDRRTRTATWART